MIVKARGISVELQVFRCLKNRMVFTEKEKSYYTNLEKGYLGEIKFDELTKGLIDHCLIVNDLTLKVTNNIFQIDSLLIFNEMLCVFEVKHLEDNFYFQTNRWYSLPSRKEINSPILQLERSETLLRKYFQTHRFSIPIESKIVFVNPTFTLYQAPIDIPVVFPTQLQHLKSTLESKRGTLTTQHIKLAKQLCDDHMVTTRLLRVPSYSYESLRKGIKCRSCGGFHQQWGNILLHCINCGDFESAEAAFVRTVKEFDILFAGRKIKTKEIYDWCRIIPSKRLVRLLLNRHLNSIGNGRSTYYDFD